MFSPSLRSRLRSSAARFAQDEAGSATVWSLTWLLGFAIMAGLAIDSTNGWRNKTMLQSTADISALAGALEIPNPLREIPYDPAPGAYDGTVKAMALEYAEKNQSMDADAFGEYLVEEDIVIGNWDRDTRTFTPGDDFASPDELPVNAVRVGLLQNEEMRGNGVPTSVLHVIGFRDWEIATAATAMIGYPECFGNAVMAQDEICIRSNNHFYAGQCFHGEGGVNFRNNNFWETDANGRPLVGVSSNGTDNVADSNFNNGLGPITKKSWITKTPDAIHAIAEAIMAGDIYFTGGPVEVYRLTANGITSNTSEDHGSLENGVQLASLNGFGSIASLLGLSSHKPGHTKGGGGGDEDPGGGGGSMGCDQGGSSGTRLPAYDGDLLAQVPPENYMGEVPGGALEQGKIYYYDGGGKLNITGDVENVVIVSEAKIDISNNARLEGVTLVSMDEISIGQGAQIGRDDECEPGGGVRMLSRGKIHAPAGTSWYGSMLVSGGNIHIAANANGIEGISAHAKGNISFTSNNSFGPAGVNGAASELGTCPVDFFVHESVLGAGLVQ